MATGRIALTTARRIVVKLGSSVILRRGLDPLVDELVEACEHRELIVVTSGAVAVGMELTGLSRRPDSIARIQALAALGQGQLMTRYGEAFSRHKRQCAQILLTHQDISHRGHFLNVRQTLRELFSLGVVPVINENDSVATEELRFGDNDRLAAAIATVVDADLVVLLSDIDGLYNANPRSNPNAVLLHEVNQIDERIEAMADGKGEAVGTGGMSSKLAAARLATEGGIDLAVANGMVEGGLKRLLSGELEGTLFGAASKRMNRRRHWIMSLSKIQGRVIVDAGAIVALRDRGSSLLAAGVLQVDSDFDRGDVVAIFDEAGALIARGLVAFDAHDLKLIAGKRSDAIASIHGTAFVAPVIHRNDMVIFATSGRPTNSG